MGVGTSFSTVDLGFSCSLLFCSVAEDSFYPVSVLLVSLQLMSLGLFVNDYCSLQVLG